MDFVKAVWCAPGQGVTKPAPLPLWRCKGPVLWLADGGKRPLAAPKKKKGPACGAHRHRTGKRASEKRSTAQRSDRRLRRGASLLNEPFKEAISLSKEDVIEVEGVVREALPNTVFKVELLNKEGKPNGHTVSHTSPANCGPTSSASCPATRSRWKCRPTT